VTVEVTVRGDGGGDGGRWRCGGGDSERRR
jgi:hypothetical protein